MTETTPEPPRLQRWRHPRTGEEATLRFEDGMIRLERGGRVSEQGPPPFDEAAAKEETRAQMLAGGWSPFELRMLRVRPKTPCSGIPRLRYASASQS